MHTRPTLPEHRTLPSTRMAGYTANSNTRNRIPGTNCTENAVSLIGFQGVAEPTSSPRVVGEEEGG
eukprot:3651257-Rhodomonas_salina.2